MSLLFLLTTVIHITVTTSSYLDTEIQQPKTENKVISKGIWINNNLKENVEKTTGDFIFRPNSLDVDNLLQNDFDTFGESFMQGSPVLSSYVERNKRSGESKRKNIIPDSLKCFGKNCILRKINDKSFKSKMMAKLRPSSLFNEYPYEVAVMLGDNNIDTPNIIRKNKESRDVSQQVIPLNENKEIKYENEEQSKVKIDSLLNIESKIGNVIRYNHSENTNNTPKRNIQNDYESEVIKKIEYIEEIDKNADNNTNKNHDRNIFDKEEKVWYQNDPTLPVKTRHDIKMYNVEPQKVKPVNERGLIRVISMLTKTFKKIMKQHSDIRKIHSKLNNLNIEVTKNIEDITKKFADIEQKYSRIVEISNKFKEYETKMDLKEEYFKMKDKEMAKNLQEFENQQKKFLTQQRQFYNIQKLMLAQNEKINMKQNLIAKTQSEISNRQYNFARVLKKAKQIYIENKKFVNPTKLLPTTSKPQDNIGTTSTETSYNLNYTTTQEPIVTDTIKINLFSIPALNKLVNQDPQILKDKDQQSVDDLVYKYYFNNTFIDNLMKSRILANFITAGENTEIARNAKTKRDEDIIENTILLPVRKIEGTLNREKRWIRHAQSKSKLKRRLRGKKFSDTEGIKDDKTFRQGDQMTNREAKKLFSVKDANDPFLVMAKSFCNEIGQNTNEQMLHWCIEKALRRLQFLEDKLPFSMPIPVDPKPTKTIAKPVPAGILTKNTSPSIPSNTMTTANLSTINGGSPTSVAPSSPVSPSAATTQNPAASTTSMYFPDNDELELNLQQFELKPDTEGNVYFDGSIHTSDMVLENDALSDIMPDLDSNSRVEMDPLTLDFQAIRRDPMRRLAELKKMAYG